MFTRAELEAIYVLFDNSQIKGIEQKEMQLAVLKKAHAAIQEDERLKASLAATIKEPAHA